MNTTDVQLFASFVALLASALFRCIGRFLFERGTNWLRSWGLHTHLSRSSVFCDSLPNDNDVRYGESRWQKRGGRPMLLVTRFHAWASGGVLYQFRFKSLAATVGTHVRCIHVRLLFVVRSVFNLLTLISPARDRVSRRCAQLTSAWTPLLDKQGR